MTKIVKLWLDDVRPAPEGWTWVKTVEDAKTVMRENKKVVAISLDHDLGDNVPTGYNFVCWLEERVAEGTMQAPVTMSVHSANPAGCRNMVAGIASIQRFAV
jgi:hypothetical protein